MKLISYRIKNDRGFAPNPYFNILTLATCKPAIRKSSNVEIGDWIVGWTAASSEKFATPVGKEKLVYLACISKIIPIAQYWYDYPQKRPDASKGKNSPEYYGDNIYMPDDSNPHGFTRENSVFHRDERNIKKDLSGKNVLICSEFYYFGAEKALNIPDEIRKDFNQVFRGHKYFYEENDILKLIDFVKNNKSKCNFSKDGHSF